MTVFLHLLIAVWITQTAWFIWQIVSLYRDLRLVNWAFRRSRRRHGEYDPY